MAHIIFIALISFFLFCVWYVFISSGLWKLYLLHAVLTGNIKLLQSRVPKRVVVVYMKIAVRILKWAE